MSILPFGTSALSTPKSLVTTVRPTLGRASASWMAVVPESIAMVSPGLTRVAARCPTRRFSSSREVRLASYGGSAAALPTRLLSMAPP